MSRQLISNSALSAWAQAGYAGTIVGATGIGKTKIAIDAIYKQLVEEPRSNIWIVVPTETLRDDGWPAEFVKWGVPEFSEQTTRLCYASMAAVSGQNIHLLVLDEGHHITAANAVFFANNTVLKILVLTATYPSDTLASDEEKYMILSELAPPVYTITIDQAVDMGIVADFDIKVCKFYLDATTKNIAGGTKKVQFMTTEKAQYGYLTKCLSRMMMLAARDPSKKGATFPWIQKRMHFIYNLPSKLRLAKFSLERLCTDGKRTLVFCGSIEQSKELCGENIYNSETDDTMLMKFQNKEINTLGVVKALDEGVNIVDLDQALIVCISSKERAAVQRIGRIIRQREGHKGLIVVLVALQTVDEKWYKSAFENFDKKRIQEYIVRVPDVKKSDPIGLAQ